MHPDQSASYRLIPRPGAPDHRIGDREHRGKLIGIPARKFPRMHHGLPRHRKQPKPPVHQVIPQPPRLAVAAHARSLGQHRRQPLTSLLRRQARQNIRAAPAQVLPHGPQEGLKLMLKQRAARSAGPGSRRPGLGGDHRLNRSHGRRLPAGISQQDPEVQVIIAQPADLVGKSVRVAGRLPLGGGASATETGIQERQPVRQ